LERVALSLAETLAGPEWLPRGEGPRRWLHVVTAAYETGGHTAFLRRWMGNDRSGDSQTVVLTGSAAVPRALQEAVERRGGGVVLLGGEGIVERAKALRMAASEADVVVLHHHMWDVVPTIAFGMAGGPPVLTVNHADHTFWVGAGVTDLAVNLRPVSAEFNRQYRSIDRNAELPIPLDPPPGVATRAALRATIRHSLGIPPEAVVFVTVGAAFKYVPIGELDFPAVAARLLDRLPQAYLITVGPSGDRPEWSKHVQVQSPRMIVLGQRRDVAAYYAAADIYVEGFPFDSATALFEAALAGLPVVPVPAVAPLPFSAHGGLKATIPQPASVAEYLDEAERLAQSATFREERARSLTQAVEDTCAADGWQRSLVALVGRLPTGHRVYTVEDVPLDDVLDRFLTRVLLGRLRLAVRRFVARIAQL
jgi:hypothetical protein